MVVRREPRLPDPAMALSASNKVASDDRAVHDWYRFVLSFPPHLVRHYLARMDVAPDDLVLDPFNGTGTTTVECKLNGVRSIGVEAHPMARFASEVKGDWTVDPGALMRHATEIAVKVSDNLQRVGMSDGSTSSVDPKKLRRLPDEIARLLLSNSISPIPLHKALVLLENIDGSQEEAFKACERLAFAKTVVSSASNLHFGPEVGVQTPKADAPVVEPWLKAVSKMCWDLEAVTDNQGVPYQVVQADARDLRGVLPRGSVGAVLCSPPYPNEKDYTRTTRLESVLLGYIRSRDDLRTLKGQLIRSNTRGVYKSDDDDSWVDSDHAIQGIAEAIEDRRIAMGKTSGFERLYPRVTKLYFGGMKRHLANLRDVLRPGAKLSYVVGDQASYLRVMIRTGQILARIAETLGYEVEGIDLFRTRLATATGEQLREEVVLLRWPGRPSDSHAD